jgi:hypothetical protein
MLDFGLAVISLIIQALVVWFGWKMYRILNPVRYWTNGWLLYTIGNVMILLRRVIGFVVAWKGEKIFTGWEHLAITNMSNVSWLSAEFFLQIAVSVVFLIFGWNLKHLYTKYFENGLKIQSWKSEQDEATDRDKVNEWKRLENISHDKEE